MDFDVKLNSLSRLPNETEVLYVSLIPSRSLFFWCFLAKSTLERDRDLFNTYSMQTLATGDRIII